MTIRPDIMQRALDRFDTCRNLGHSLHYARVAARTAIQNRATVSLVEAETAIADALKARANVATRPGVL